MAIKITEEGVIMDKLTEKSTKKEYQKALKEALKEVKTLREEKATPVKVAEKKRQSSVVSNANNFTVKDMVAGLTELKTQTIQTLSGLTNSFETWIVKYNDLKEAVEVASRELEEVHEIKRTAETLEALELTNIEMIAVANKKKGEIFEEIQIRREASDVSQQMELEKRIEARKKECDEYEYNLTIKRRDELDRHQQSCNQRRKDFDHEMNTERMANEERMEELLKREVELQRLQNLEECMDQNIATKVETAVNEAKKSWEASQRIKTLTEDRAEKESLALTTEHNKILLNRNVELQEELAEYKKDIHESQRKVESIAEKAIQASANAKITVNQESAGKR